ncbi:hypothetical protein Tco_0886986 [Tanacetum coccineum]
MQVNPSTIKSTKRRIKEHRSDTSSTHPQDTDGNTQPVVKVFHSPLDEGTRKSKPLSEGLPSLTTSGTINNLTDLLRNANLPEIITQLNTFQTSLNTLISQCASISYSLKEDLEFNQRLLNAAEGYILNSTRLTKIASNLMEINFPSLQSRITAIENTQVTMQAVISFIKKMVTEMFRAFKGLSSATPLGSTTIPTATLPKAHATVGGEFRETSGCLAKNLPLTKREQLSIINTIKEPEVETIKKKPEHEHEDTKPIPIIIVRATTKPTLKAELITSSLGSTPTDLVIDITPPEKQPEIQHTT